MTARERVLKAYGGQCRYCWSPGPLHIDHIFGGGNAHRHTLGCRSTGCAGRVVDFSRCRAFVASRLSNYPDHPYFE